MIGATLSDRAAVSNEGIQVETRAASGLNMVATRLSPGAISESSSSHLPPIEASKPPKRGVPKTRDNLRRFPVQRKIDGSVRSWHSTVLGCGALNHRADSAKR